MQRVTERDRETQTQASSHLHYFRYTSQQVVNAFLQEAIKFKITFHPVSATGPLTEVKDMRFDKRCDLIFSIGIDTRGVLFPSRGPKWYAKKNSALLEIFPYPLPVAGTRERIVQRIPETGQHPMQV
jgi:hypothetical protein